MPHDDFFEATLIEFTHWIDNKESSIAKFDRFDDLPSNLMDHFKTNSKSEITLNGKRWKILEINKDIRAHGKGIHVKVRLELYARPNN